MRKIGVSACGFALTEENFFDLKKSGLSAIEICRQPGEYDDINYGEIKTFAERYGINLWSFHLPFWPFTKIDISSPDKELRKGSVEYLSEFIKNAADIGIDKFVIHSSGEWKDGSLRSERMKCAKDTLCRLAEIAASCGGMIAVEDLPRTCLGNSSQEIAELISADDRLRVCFDTNHLLKEDNMEFMDKLGDKIITVHVSDYDFVDEKHWLPGEGKNDWQAMMKKFDEIGYSGAWIYEMGLKSPEKLGRSRDLVFEDFYNNAMSLFAGKIPKKI
ncbi:MAG: sugar phosphate isomerase/epimerase [Clostridia bacterium]|nr:sugar phosphate isomerase/epimerase [Clostridia bacterium]